MENGLHSSKAIYAVWECGWVEDELNGKRWFRCLTRWTSPVFWWNFHRKTSRFQVRWCTIEVKGIEIFHQNKELFRLDFWSDLLQDYSRVNFNIRCNAKYRHCNENFIDEENNFICTAVNILCSYLLICENFSSKFN